jgi:hypothetical protein
MTTQQGKQMATTSKQVYEWVKTGHWTFQQFNEWVSATHSENYLLQQQIEMVRDPGSALGKQGVAENYDEPGCHG